MGNCSFYRRLEIARGITKRRELISQLLKNSDLVSLFGKEAKNAKLLEDLALPSDSKNKLSLPFAVGFKYELDEPYDSKKHFAYILGIVELPSGEKNLLTVCDGKNDDFCCLRRGYFCDPLYT